VSKVELGDVRFDPTDPSDWSLSVEGTKGTGKSNTLAVILEELADVTFPTLIIERVGALLPVRVADESIIVVGETDEPHVDLVVPLGGLTNVGGWVLDRGLKVFVDISTYSDYESQESRVHLAAAKAVKSLMDRAEQKYKQPGETRTKSLLVADEADWLAPKDNAPVPSYKGDNVRTCRGHMVRAATEGGNFGVTPVVAYQRRAFIHNGVINLCRDWIVHGLESEDIDRAAKSLRVDDDLIDGLQTGDIVAKGAHITDGDVVGATTVRKRETPDPREDEWTLPETPPEMESVVESIQQSIATDERDTDGDGDDSPGRVEELEAENDRLRERLEAAQEGDADQSLKDEMGDLRDRLEHLKADRDGLQIELESATTERDELQEEVERLEARIAELESLDRSVDEAAHALHEALDTLGRGDPDSRDATEQMQHLRGRVDELEAENERLREAGGVAGMPPEDADYLEFVEQDPVRDAIAEAVEDSGASRKYVKGVVSAIVDVGGPVGYGDIADRLGVATTSDISKAATTLAKKNVVSKNTNSTPYEVDLNIGGIEAIVAARKKQQRTANIMEEI
jgi:phage shock protein A